MKARVANESLADALDQRTVVGDSALCRVEENRVRCLACGHRCLIGDGLRGICKVRFNDAGQLKVPYGYVAGLQCDPVEKKPFFHVYPGSDALTFGMMGCDLHCSYCQNWLTSQALRDSNSVAPIRPITPSQLVEVARREGARLVVSSYNEPLITAEWAVGVFREANAAGIACAFVSNGNATPEVLDFLRPWIIAYKVDLKSFDDNHYRSLGGTLDNITQTIRMIHERGLWLEIVTLIIPGFNDNPDELRRAAEFLASISRDIPWHVTAFHRDYKMTEPEPTSAETLIRAAEIGTAAGLRFVYAGNLPGRVGPWENTRCPFCRATVIERVGYLIRSYRLTADGRCPDCQTRLPGVWPGAAAEVRTGNDMIAYQGRLPRRVAAALPIVEAVTPMSDKGIPTMSPAVSDATNYSSPPRLTAEQQEQLVAAVHTMLRAVVVGQPAVFPAELPELRDHLIGGAFVSLKTGRHLRSCHGLIAQAVSLGTALEQATANTALHDARFPPISPTELGNLDVEVWLLHSPRPVPVRGEARLEAITLGKHGVQIERGQARGLFLPSVAVENEWNTRQLLDRVCAKAGLPPTAWKEDDTVLSVFEGEAFRSGPGTARSEAVVSARVPPCQPEQLATYADFCRRELFAMLTGGTPSYYLWGVPDANVHGVVLLLPRPNNEGIQQFSHISMRNTVPIQSTLSALIQGAARHLATWRLNEDQLATLQVGLMFLHDPVMHGTVADPQLGGLDPKRRTVLVAERNKSALLYEPNRSAAELITEAANQAKVSQPDSATVFSFDTLSNVSNIRITAVPLAVRGPAIRPAAVAGNFYDSDPAALARTVDSLLTGERRAEEWPAALVPHAGLKFSGRIAADVLKRIRIPRTIIVLGPKHTPQGVDWAVAPHQTWQLPGGEVQSDFMLARQLCQAIPGLEMDAVAHQGEHAIEVELPLLARLAPESKVVGIAIGHGDLESCRGFAERLAGLLRKRTDHPLLLISSDMNHFASDAENRRLDALALAALERGNAEELYETVNENNISMCGILPAVIVLETLRFLGGTRRAERVGYATTADVTGDTSRVVGYAGMLLG